DVEHVGDDLEFGDRFAAEAWLTEAGSGHLLRDLLAVEIELPQIVHVAGADAVADVVGGDALHQLRQLHPVASLQRQRLHLPSITAPGWRPAAPSIARMLTPGSTALVSSTAVPIIEPCCA